MQYDEAILIKQWDSEGSFAKDGCDGNQEDESFISTFALHSAVLDPTVGNDVAPRQSIEVRLVVLF